MKKLAAVLLLLQVLSGSLDARCINAKHKKIKKIVIDGTQEDSAVYACPVKAQEANRFDDKDSCKFCGCSKNDHDNTSA